MSRPKPEGAGAGAGETDPDAPAGGLSDRDCYAILSAGGMGGKNGFTLADYARHSDRQIAALLSIEWDEDGRLVTEAPRGPAAPDGSIAAAGRELPSPEQLGFSDAAMQEMLAARPLAVDMRYWSMFCSIWQRRGKNNDAIRALWFDHLASNN